MKDNTTINSGEESRGNLDTGIDDKNNGDGAYRPFSPFTHLKEKVKSNLIEILTKLDGGLFVTSEFFTINSSLITGNLISLTDFLNI